MFLQTQGITKDFGKLRAVDQVSLEIRKGDIHAIIGPNGAGKSTYFNLITGYHPATSGKVLFKGEEITDMPALPSVQARDHPLLSDHQHLSQAHGL